VLTGPESLTQREQLAIIGEVLGRTLVFDQVSPDATRREVLAGAPVWVIDMLLSAYGAAVDRPALVTSAIETVTSIQYRRFGVSRSGPGHDVLQHAPFFSIVLIDPTLSSSHVTSTRPRPSSRLAIRSDWRSIAVAYPRR
jgi:hypothetical protein